MPDPEKTETTKNPEQSLVLSGVTEKSADGKPKFLDGNPHYGVAVVLTSGSGESTLMMPDVTAKEPVYVTRPIVLELVKLKAFLTAKGIALPDAVGRLLKNAKISCDAFYYSKTVRLFMFALSIEDGLIATLSGDPDLGTLFDIKRLSVRVIQCKEDSFSVLQGYVAELSGEPAKEPA